MLDGNVFNSLADDNGAQTAIRALIDNELLCIIVPAIVMLELSESPFKGIPKFFPVSVVPDSVAIAGLAIAGLVCPGEGEIFSKHLGESKKAKDAILADAANATADFQYQMTTDAADD